MLSVKHSTSMWCATKNCVSIVLEHQWYCFCHRHSLEMQIIPMMEMWEIIKQFNVLLVMFIQCVSLTDHHTCEVNQLFDWFKHNLGSWQVWVTADPNERTHAGTKMSLLTWCLNISYYNVLNILLSVTVNKHILIISIYCQ